MSSRETDDTTPQRKLLPMREVERLYIDEVLEQTQGNRTEAAQMLGFDRKTLYRKLLCYNIHSADGRGAV